MSTDCFVNKTNISSSSSAWNDLPFELRSLLVAHPSKFYIFHAVLHLCPWLGAPPSSSLLKRCYISLQNECMNECTDIEIIKMQKGQCLVSSLISYCIVTSLLRHYQVWSSIKCAATSLASDLLCGKSSCATSCAQHFRWIPFVCISAV